MPQATACPPQTLYRVSIASMLTEEDMNLREALEDCHTFDQIMADYVPDGESRETLHFVDLTHLAITSNASDHDAVAAEGWCKSVGLGRLGRIEEAGMTPPDVIRRMYRSAEMMKQFVTPLPSFLDFLLVHLGVEFSAGAAAHKTTAWFLNDEFQTWVIQVHEIRPSQTPDRSSFSTQP